MATRQMALTPSLVAQIHRVVEDPGPDPNVVYHTEEDYDALVRHLLLSHRPDQDLWLFAYGSLIWKSEVDHIEERIGTAHGWHRAFRLRITRWRASADQPGLMMGLDRGGQCRGALFRITAPSVEENLGKLVRREMSAKPPTNVARWIRVETNTGPVRPSPLPSTAKAAFMRASSRRGDRRPSGQGMWSLGLVRLVSPR
jgi:cation transport protein ChaC